MADLTPWSLQRQASAADRAWTAHRRQAQRLGRPEATPCGSQDKARLRNMGVGEGLRRQARQPWGAGWNGVEPAVNGPQPDLDVLGDASVRVDIYLSAGLHEGYGTDSYHSCNANDDSNCDLYRVRVRLAPGPVRFGEVERVVVGSDRGTPESVGVVEPAVSPSGRRLAYLRRWGTHEGRGVSDLEAMDLDGRGVTLVASGTGDARPQFPNWFQEGTLLFHAGAKDAATSYSAQVADEGDLRFGTPRALLGPASGTSTGTSFADANTRTATAMSEPFGHLDVTTFGVSTEHGTREQPRVHSLRASSPGSGSVATQEFDLGVNRRGETIGECHHSAWNPGGDTILCTVHDPPERYPSGAASTSRLLYMYRRVAGEWRAVSPQPFDPLEPEELFSTFPSLYPLADAEPGCERYSYKYAEWCVGDDHLVATVFCENGLDSKSDPIFVSRVHLIHVPSRSYYDLTSEVERFEGVSEGEYHGIFSTCARAGAQV